MATVYFVCSGGGLRTTFFAGFARGFLDGLKARKLNYTIGGIYVASGSALTLPLAFTMKEYEVLTFLEDFSYPQILTLKARTYNEAKIYHGFFDFTADFYNRMKVVLRRLGSLKRNFYVTRLVYPDLKNQYVRITAEYALDSARLPVLIVPRPEKDKLIFDGGIGEHVPISLLLKKRLRKDDIVVICVNHSPPLKKQLIDFRKLLGASFIASMVRLYLTDPVIKQVLKHNKEDTSLSRTEQFVRQFQGTTIFLTTTGSSSLLPASTDKLFVIFSKGKAVGFKVGKDYQMYSKLELNYAI